MRYIAFIPGSLLLLSCGSGTQPSQPDIDTCFKDTLTSVASTLKYEDIFGTQHTAADSLYNDSLYIDSTGAVVMLHRPDSIPADPDFQLEEPE